MAASQEEYVWPAEPPQEVDERRADVKEYEKIIPSEMIQSNTFFIRKYLILLMIQKHSSLNRVFHLKFLTCYIIFSLWWFGTFPYSYERAYHRLSSLLARPDVRERWEKEGLRS